MGVCIEIYRAEIGLFNCYKLVCLRCFFYSICISWTLIVCLQSIGPLKKALFSFFNVPSYNVIYHFEIERFNAIIHTRLRLDACALNYCLFKIGCRERPACFCGFHTETVKHFFLNYHFILTLELLCSPLLLGYLLTGGLLCLNHKLYPFFCLALRYCRWSKIMIYFFMFSHI